MESQEAESPENLKSQGNEYFKSSKYSLALECYKKALDLKPDFTDAWFNLALVYKKQGAHRYAKEAFQKVLNLNPQHLKAQYHLTLLEMPAQLFFGIVDIKLTQDNQVKILEFGNGFQSGFVGHDQLYPDSQSMQRKLDQAITKFKPFFCNTRLGSSLIKDNALPLFLNQVQSSPQSKSSSKMADYKGIYGGYRLASVNNDILIMNNSPLWHLAAEDKSVMHSLFEKSGQLNYRPRCKIFSRQYDQNLTNKIKTEIPAKRYVLKVPDLSRGEGVIVVESEDLDDFLKFLLLDNPDQLADATLQYINRKKSDVSQILISTEQWRKSANGVFMVEEYCPSKLITHDQKKYDATMRVAFLILFDDGNKKYIPLGCYWKMPENPVGEGELRAQSISHIKSDKVSSLSVTEEDQKLVHAQLQRCLPQVFQEMFFLNITELTQSFADNKLQQGALLLHYANALGQLKKIDEAKKIMKQIKIKNNSYYHEKGLLYFSINNYPKALEKFNKAISLDDKISATFFRRAAVYKKLNKKTEAWADLEKAKALGFDTKILEIAFHNLRK